MDKRRKLMAAEHAIVGLETKIKTLEGGPPAGQGIRSTGRAFNRYGPAPVADRVRDGD
jgi:hypothetical protein